MTKDGEVVPVTVEVEVKPGIGIHMIGLADSAVKESLLRVVTALQSQGYSVPGKKIIINLAPADLRKEGTGYDLPIALGILVESGQAEFDPGKVIYYGELGLDGSLRDPGDAKRIWTEIPIDRPFVCKWKYPDLKTTVSGETLRQGCGRQIW